MRDVLIDKQLLRIPNLHLTKKLITERRTQCNNTGKITKKFLPTRQSGDTLHDYIKGVPSFLSTDEEFPECAHSKTFHISIVVGKRHLLQIGKVTPSVP